MAILRRCSADYRPPYEFAEDDLAASVFWFSRSNHDLIEICLNGPESITTRVELPVEGVPWLLKPFLGTCRHEETLDSMEGAVERVRQFFELSAAEFRFLLTAKA